MKVGQKFGSGKGGISFDDSSSSWFTSTHYLSGILVSDIYRFAVYEFIYTSPDDNQTRNESDFHRIYRGRGNSTVRYDLHSDERIDKVAVRCWKSYLLRITIIKDIQFFTTHDRTIPPDIQPRNDSIQYESFPGYTLGYVTGKASTHIHQLQFVWYRTKTSE